MTIVRVALGDSKFLPRAFVSASLIASKNFWIRALMASISGASFVSWVMFADEEMRLKCSRRRSAVDAAVIWQISARDGDVKTYRRGLRVGVCCYPRSYSSFRRVRLTGIPCRSRPIGELWIYHA